jgi:hypothetical protein
VIRHAHVRCIIVNSWPRRFLDINSRFRLSVCEEAFAHYVIAHEFAHAYLRNGPWGNIFDPEDAADALAASWGFPRPV